MDIGKDPLHFRVFLSSPGDVSEERRIARKILQALPQQPAFRGQITIDVIAWDDPDAPAPIVATETPQASVNRFTGKPSMCDLTIVILWGRLGTPLPADVTRTDKSQYQSGTEWEYEDARNAGKPVWIYRRTEKPLIEIDDPKGDDKRKQFQNVARFFEQFKNATDGSLKGGINSYKTPKDFRELLQKQLETYLSEEIKARNALSQDDSLLKTHSGIAKNIPIVIPDAIPDHKIVGRDALINDLWQQAQRGENSCLVVLPGIGKTAVALELLRKRDEILHHFDGILWANLGRQFVMLEELVKWAEALDVSHRNKLTSEEAWKKAVKAKIGQRRLLIVLDDVYQTKKALEFKALGSNCVYVITTRRRDVAEELVRQELVTVVEELDDTVGLELLKDIAPKAVEYDRTAAQALVGAVQGLPLALVLVGKYLKKMSSQADPDRIGNAFRKLQHAGELLNLKPMEDESTSLADIIDISYGALESEKVREAFLALSIFRPKPSSFSKDIAQEVCGADADTIYELSDMGLIEHYGDGNYTMHRIIADYARDKLNRLDAEASKRLHYKALDYYAQKLEKDIDYSPGAYLGNYRIEQADWQAMKDAWLHHLAHTGDTVRASHAFLRVYFDAFWWWGYYQRFPFCDALIREWRQRDISPDVREGLRLLTAFQEAYPSGHGKRGSGNWSQVESSLRGLRKQLKLDEEATLLLGEDARRVCAFTEFFLAETYAYGRMDRDGALHRYKTAYNLFMDDGNKWEAAWTLFYVGQFLQEEADFTTARNYALNSLSMSEATPLAEGDPELLANNYRLLGDLDLASHDVNAAIGRYRRAAFYAYVFQGIPEAADSYTMAFYEEITGRIADKTMSLYITNRKQGLKLCNEIREFWSPYWTRYPAQANHIDLETALASDKSQLLAAYMFPLGLASNEIKDGAAHYQQQVLSIIEPLRTALAANVKARKSSR